jgi:hypothetical protein
LGIGDDDGLRGLLDDPAQPRFMFLGPAAVGHVHAEGDDSDDPASLGQGLVSPQDLALLALLGEDRILEAPRGDSLLHELLELLPGVRIAVAGDQPLEPGCSHHLGTGVPGDLFGGGVEIAHDAGLVQLQEDHVGGLDDAFCEGVGALQSLLRPRSLGDVDRQADQALDSTILASERET